MPRNGSGVYALPGTYEAVSGETIEAQQHNDPLEDLESDANDVRPVVAGGTGVSSTSLPDTWTRHDPSDSTKKVRIDAGSITAGQTRVLTAPDRNGTIQTVNVPEQTAPSTAANEVAIYAKEFGGTATPYYRKESDGAEIPLTGAWELISSSAISNVATFDLTGLSAYRMIRITWRILPATDGVTILLRTSTDNGSNYDAGTGYTYSYAGGSNTTFVGARTTGASAVVISGLSAGNASGEGASGEITLKEFNQADICLMDGRANLVNNSGLDFPLTISCSRGSTTARNALRIFASSGNISGFVTVEGVRG